MNESLTKYLTKENAPVFDAVNMLLNSDSEMYEVLVRAGLDYKDFIYPRMLDEYDEKMQELFDPRVESPPQTVSKPEYDLLRYLVGFIGKIRRESQHAARSSILILDQSYEGFSARELGSLLNMHHNSVIKVINDTEEFEKDLAFGRYVKYLKIHNPDVWNDRSLVKEVSDILKIPEDSRTMTQKKMLNLLRTLSASDSGSFDIPEIP